ncbi:universal stress protein [Spirillospora sp. CA-294931]|uniref:universal stress protein n=1 Tax=Spirillospora sp. CA-294931 TaxID=3240042 RepID=UPI003D90E9A8
MIGEHVLAGFVNDAGGREALAFARAIVALTGGGLTVGNVHAPDRPGAAAESETILEQADAPGAEFATQESRGSGRGLSVLASKTGADLIVIGSPAGGAKGRVGIGSTADNLLHSATEAVMLTPSGYEPPERLHRITVAYVRRPQVDEAVVRAALAALKLDVPLRLLTLAIGDVDDDRLRDDLALAIRLATDSGIAPESVTAELAEGDDVAEALSRAEWPDGEILVCASSEDATAHRVFVGEVSLKVLRAAPCPVTVLPRGYS